MNLETVRIMEFRSMNLLMLFVMLLVTDPQICSGSQLSMDIATNIDESVKKITEGDIRTVHFNFTILEEMKKDNIHLAVCVSVQDKDVALVGLTDLDHPDQFDLSKHPTGQFIFPLKALFVGRTKLYVKFVFYRRRSFHPCKMHITENAQYNIENNFNLTITLPPGKDTSVSFDSHCEIVVARPHTAVNTAFNVGVVILVLLVNLGVGCKTDLSVIKSTLRRPVAPVIGFCSQFIIMPLISYGAVKVFRFEPALAIGVFALGCSPGGSASNAYTMLLDGDVSLSITMTFISTVAALGMVPLWLLTLGPTLYSDTSIQIPYQNILYSLLGLLASVCLGLLIQWKRPEWARKMVTISKGLMVVFLIFVLTVGIYCNHYIFHLVSLEVLGTSSLLPYMGFILGGLVAYLFRLTNVQVLTVAIETGIQNTGIAIVLLLLSLDPPEADISIVTPIVSAMFTPLPLWVAIAVVQGRKRCCPKEEEEGSGGGGENKGDKDKEALQALQGEGGGRTEEKEKEEENPPQSLNVENGVGLISSDAAEVNITVV